jgi:excisionase family DNA binding protein
MAHKITTRFSFVRRGPETCQVKTGETLVSTNIATKEWLTVADLCELLGISRTLAYQLVAEHTIPAVRIGRAIRVRRADVEKWLGENRY